MKVLVNRPDLMEKNGAARQFDCDCKRYHANGTICVKVKDSSGEYLVPEKSIVEIRR